jgi:hypothetical protein
MTDEHKRECEYHALAAQAGGLTADCEVTTSRKTRVDVVVDGRLGFEIQHSEASIDAVRGRTARSVAAGLESVSWFTDRQQSPVWYGLVPSYGTTMRSWDKLPRLGTVTAYGPRIVEAVACRYDTFSRCPDGKPRPCGKWHPKDRNVSLLVDEVVTRMAAGDLVPARIGKYVRITDRASMALYEELTGKSALYGAALPLLRTSQAEDKRIDCTRPIGWSFPGGKQLELNFAQLNGKGPGVPELPIWDPCPAWASQSPRPPLTPTLQTRPGSTSFPQARYQPSAHTASNGVCNVVGCDSEGRLYMTGLRCERHEPSMALYLRKAE